MTRLTRERISVLWIEDGAAVEVPHLTTPLFVTGRYNLVIAKDAGEGIRLLGRPGEQFDVVILDLHLAPGDNAHLIERYQARPQSYDPNTSIGMSILIDLFDPDREDDLRVILRPDWLTPDRIGLLTVEPISNVSETLLRLGIDERSFVQKGATMPATALKDLVDHIYRRRQSGANRT